MAGETTRTSMRLRICVAPDGSSPLPAPPQFAHIARYWHSDHQCFAARLLPGEYYVTRHPEVIATVLGSCVSACIRDTRLGIGGMNHFMLPHDGSNGESAWSSEKSNATRFGNVAMDRLIRDIVALGGRREDLEVKLVGGGRVLAEVTSDIGARNIEFVREYLREASLGTFGEDLGGVHARRVVYFPQTGRIRVRPLAASSDDTLLMRESRYLEQLETKAGDGEDGIVVSI
jgi:chemotaxis protein CheD